jgi:hypothetical protein
MLDPDPHKTDADPKHRPGDTGIFELLPGTGTGFLWVQLFLALRTVIEKAAEH